MNCKHEEIILFPEDIKNIDDRIVIKDIENCLVVCRSCDKVIANEDVELYPSNKRFVGIPRDLVDEDSISR